METLLKKYHIPLWLGFGLFAFLLRLPLLSGSFWLDEAAQALESTRPWSEQFLLAADFQPPFFHVWVHFLQLMSQSEAWLRLASVLPGIFTVACFTALAERHFSRRAAFWTGLLLSTSSLMVFFSQELRPYMFAVGWSSLASFAFFELLFPWKDQFSQGRQRVFLIVFTLCNAVTILSSYVALFFLPAFLVVTYLLRRNLTLAVVKSLLVSGLFFGAWFLGLREQLVVGNELRSALPGWDQVVSLPQAKSFLLTLGKFVTGRLPLDLNVLDTLLIAVPLVLLVAPSVWLVREQTRSRFRAAVVLFVTPLVLTWFFSFIIPVLEPKRVLFLVPWLFLLVGVVATRWPRSWVVGSIWGAIQIFGLISYWQDPLLQREPWRAVVMAVEETYQPENTVAVFGFDAPFAPWRWYEQEGIATISTGLDPLDSELEAREALATVGQYENVIVFDYLRDLTDPERQIEAILIQKGYREIAVWDYPNIGFVRLFYRDLLFAYSGEGFSYE